MFFFKKISIKQQEFIFLLDQISKLKYIFTRERQVK